MEGEEWKLQEIKKVCNLNDRSAWISWPNKIKQVKKSSRTRTHKIWLSVAFSHSCCMLDRITHLQLSNNRIETEQLAWIVSAIYSKWFLTDIIFNRVRCLRSEECSRPLAQAGVIFWAKFDKWVVTLFWSIHKLHFRLKNQIQSKDI